jgi:hypothetical protein
MDFYLTILNQGNNGDIVQIPRNGITKDDINKLREMQYLCEGKGNKYIIRQRFWRNESLYSYCYTAPMPDSSKTREIKVSTMDDFVAFDGANLSSFEASYIIKDLTGKHPQWTLAFDLTDETKHLLAFESSTHTVKEDDGLIWVRTNIKSRQEMDNEQYETGGEIR